LIEALPDGVYAVAVEISNTLCRRLNTMPKVETVHEADFLNCNGDLGTFSRVVMNPPFKNGEDIKHVKHALTFLRPGGRLVSIVANGPRQQRELKPLGEWIELERGVFAEQGTNVNAAILIVDAD
jgi:16S rRNA G1207 methylase RsmC